MANIGIYGGSFNPIHTGHIHLAEWIVCHTPLDQIWLMISPNNPLKDKHSLIDQNKRLQWAETALKGHNDIRVSNFEFTLPQPSYTVQTLQALQQAYPQHTFSLIIGEDNLALFQQWKNWQTILHDYPLFVYPRKGYNTEKLKQNYPTVTFLSQAPLFPISSTDIRRGLLLGNDMHQWIPETILQDVKNTFQKQSTTLSPRNNLLNSV